MNVPKKRKGNILILSALLMASTCAVLASAVDLGYLYVAQAELQHAADSAAIAAAWELVDEDVVSQDDCRWYTCYNAFSKAEQFVYLNTVGGDAPVISYDDVTLGYMADPTDPNSQLVCSDPSNYNAVQVRVRRTTDMNGELPLFFARVIGRDSAALEAEATAAILRNIGGFRAPDADTNLDILPFALDEETWNEMLAGCADDDWHWDSEIKQITSGGDGVLEVNLFPQDTGAPGNRGTVDIGGNNNSTNDIARQIVEGVSQEDLDHIGGSLELDANGELILNGDTGISAGVKDELESIKGEPRIIPIFRDVSGPGNNAMYTIVQFAGVRIMDVKLTGKASSKRVIIQPAVVVMQGGIPAPSDVPTSKYVYSPAWLVR